MHNTTYKHMTGDSRLQELKNHLLAEFSSLKTHLSELQGELTLIVESCAHHELLKQLQHYDVFAFDMLVDLCAVDYLTYGESDWETEQATSTGFSRGVQRQKTLPTKHASRFAVVYHLLSTTLNHRLRVKVFLEESHPVIASVHDIWPVADWFEREAYDLYGILFENHPDLRRILTDYGFIGHPFRKDFPLSGHVEVRYDAALGRVIYEPVQIEPRVTVPRVIRHDNRYFDEEKA